MAADRAISLYAVDKGFMDDIDLSQIATFEKGLQDHMNSNHADIMAQINESGDWNDDLEAAFKAGVEAFKQTGSW